MGRKKRSNKKKNQYIQKVQQTPRNSSQTKINSQLRYHQKSYQTLPNNSKNSEDEQQQLEYPSQQRHHQSIYSFPFTQNNILRLFLSGTIKIKDPHSNYYKLDLQKQQLIGDEQICKKIINESIQYIQTHVGKKYTSNSQDLQLNKRKYIQKKYNALIFQKKSLLFTCNQLIRIYKYQKIINIINTVDNSLYFYIILLKKSLQQQYDKWYQQNKNRQITRPQIKEVQPLQYPLYPLKKTRSQHIYKQKIFTQKPNKNEYILRQNGKKKLYVEKQYVSNNVQRKKNYTLKQPDSSFNNIQHMSQGQSSNNEEQLYQTANGEQQQQQIQQSNYYSITKALPVKQSKQSQPITEQQTQVTLNCGQFFQDLFDRQNFQQWLKENKVINVKLTYKQNKNKIKIILCFPSSCKKYDSLIRQYFFYSKIKLFQIQDYQNEQNKKLIFDKFCKNNKKQISCQFIQGYTSQYYNTQQTLLPIIIKKYYSSQMKKHHTLKFCVILIQGLKSLVQNTYNQIITFISIIPKFNKIQQIQVTFGKIDDYLNQNQVQSLIKNSIKQYFMNYQQVKLEKVCFNATKTILHLQIQHSFYNKFINDTLKNVKSQLKQSLTHTQVLQQSQLTQQLQSSYLLYPSKQNPKSIILIQTKQKTPQSMRKIIQQTMKNKNVLITKQIEINKNHLQKFKKMLQTLMQNQSNKNKYNIQYSFDQSQKLKIFGANQNIKQFTNIIANFITQLNQSIKQKIFLINYQQKLVLQKNFQKFTQQLQKSNELTFKISTNVTKGAIIKLKKVSDLKTSPLTILIKKNHSLSILPKKTLILFQRFQNVRYFYDKSCKKFTQQFQPLFKNFNNYLQTFQQDHQKQHYYLFQKKIFKNAAQMIKFAKQFYFSHKKVNLSNYAFFMPKKNKKQFISQIITFFQQQINDNPIKVFLFQQQQQNFQAQLKNLQKQKKIIQKPVEQSQYYIVEKQSNKQFYYSQQGDKKISSQLKKGKTTIYLTNKQLNLTLPTHYFSKSKLLIQHIQSGNQLPIKLKNNKYTFQLNSMKFEIPNQQINSPYIDQLIQISLGVYQLDLTSLKQTNLFTGFQRSLHKKKITINQPCYSLQIQIQNQCNSITIFHDIKQQQHALNAYQKLKQLIETQKIQQIKKFDKDITKTQFQQIQKKGQDMGVDVQFNHSKCLTLKSFDKHSLSTISKAIQLILSESNYSTIKYPTFWQPQTQQIQLFNVAPKCQQFENVQKHFSLGKIKKLTRIQNKFAFKKFYHQKLSLAQLNDGKLVKQMWLFHGTSKTEPKVIYQDKQQCFNTNFTSDNNFLGRGTYFAQKSQYSHSYSYVSQGIISTRQMFYCQVLVGQSQSVNVIDEESRNMKTTGYKDKKKQIRYQSATTFTNNSIIYAVYKNSRAYPHYLITY